MLTALPYFGGKSPAPGARGTGPWIASMLPMRRYYGEPFCGMAGVLLARPRAVCEALNDLDGRIICWWRAVRDHPEEFGHLVEFTPAQPGRERGAVGQPGP